MSAESLNFRPEFVTRFGYARFASSLAQCADVNQREAKGRTALFLAARVGREAHLKALVSHGANPNLTDNADEAPLQAAARYGHSGCVGLLLDAGAHIDHVPDSKKTAYSETALRSAVWHRKEEVAMLLLARGANPNVVSEKKLYPLHAAAYFDNAQLCAALIRAGATIDARGQQGLRALCHALEHASLETVRALLELGADPNGFGIFGRRPLTSALFREQGDCIPFLYELLKAKADVTMRNEDGSSAISWACRLENQEAVELFASLGAVLEEQPTSSSVVINIGGGNEAEIHFSPARRVTPSAADEAMAKRISSRPAGLNRNYGWQASPRHLVILKVANNPLTLDRVAYFARGYLNVPSGKELDDGPKVLGESYAEAVDRFVQLGLLRVLDTAEAVALNATGDELKRLARGQGLRPPPTKSGLVDFIVEQLPAMANEIAARKRWYCSTERGAQFVSDEKTIAEAREASTRSMLNHLQAAIEERNLEGMLLIHLNLQALCGGRQVRSLSPNAITDVRCLLDGEWPESVVCNKSDQPRYRAVMAMLKLVPDRLWDDLHWDWKRWDILGPIRPPEDEDRNPVYPGFVMSELCG